MTTETKTDLRCAVCRIRTNTAPCAEQVHSYLRANACKLPICVPNEATFRGGNCFDAHVNYPGLKAGACSSSS